MKAVTVPLVLIAWIGAAVLSGVAIGSEPADDTKAKDDTATTAMAESEEGEFKPPRGFAKKKHGKHVLYCKRESTIGTRFKTEKCYSEEQMRDYVIAQAENKRDIDRVRSTCSNVCACGQAC